jgi:hypothetical protein
MEKRVNTKIEQYVRQFKDDIRNKITELDIQTDKSKINELLEFVYDYQRLSLIKEDLVKRLRVKNSIPSLNRCFAKRANGEQCTRRKREDCEYCGTHSKGIPHGFIELNEKEKQRGEKIEIFVKDFKGIVYYIDHSQNVYKTEDILDGKLNPTIIAKYVISPDGNYTIPELGLL